MTEKQAERVRQIALSNEFKAFVDDYVSELNGHILDKNTTSDEAEKSRWAIWTIQSFKSKMSDNSFLVKHIK